VRLLVSVVSADEARRALAGGADIIDIKDPREGALGAPSPRVVSEVVRVVGGAAPVSVALGDMPDLPHTAALAAGGAVDLGARYVKVGLRGVRSVDRAVALMRAVADAVGPGSVGVVAAAYADAQALDPPALAPVWLPEVVARAGVSGALIDTFVKDGRGLYEWLSEDDVVDLVARTRAVGGSFGVAGQLGFPDLGRVAADVVGVRSAVCRGGDRSGELDRSLVAAAIAEVRGQSGVIRVPASPGARTTTVTPVRRTASGR
jgi:(5-formylfuran-3-yl)methyl phosphate synthase